MLNADKLTLEDVKRIFPDREFTEAAGVLEMISNSPEQQMRYEARLKFQRDEATRLEQARVDLELAREKALREGREDGLREGEAKGEAKGIQKGVLLGRIALLQELLGVSRPKPEELSDCDEIRLSEIADQLQSELRNPRAHK